MNNPGITKEYLTKLQRYMRKGAIPIDPAMLFAMVDDEWTFIKAPSTEVLRVPNSWQMPRSTKRQKKRNRHR